MAMPLQLTHRFGARELGWLWAYSFTVFWVLLSGSIRLAFVASVFITVNAAILIYWFTLPATDANILHEFMRGLKAGAHRGLQMDAPENTLAAIRLSKERGATAVEIDVELSSDDHAVLLHDDTVDRTTDGSGPIRHYTLEQLKTLNAAANFHDQSRFNNESVPTLVEALDLCKQLDLKVFLDIKGGNMKMVEVLKNLYKENTWMYRNVAVCSFFHQIAYEMKNSDASVIIGHTWRPGMIRYADPNLTVERFPSSFVKQRLASVLDWINERVIHLILWRISAVDLILAQRRIICQSYVDMWKSRGVSVVAWTVNDPLEKLYFGDTLGISYLTDTMPINE